MIDFLLERFAQHPLLPAVVVRDQVQTYGDLLRGVARWREQLDRHGIGCGAVVAVAAEYSGDSVALLLSLIERNCVTVPLPLRDPGTRRELLTLCGARYLVELGAGEPAWCELEAREVPELIAELRRRQHPGLVLFSSGSTGKPKGIVNDWALLLDRYRAQKQPVRAVSFLLFDHIGGINTCFSILSSLGCLVTVSERSPDAVCAAIEKHAAGVLPTSPTFLTLLLLSGAHTRHDLRSLRVVTYGTEPMPEETLLRLGRELPWVRLKQTYGLSEVGILSTQSRSSDSLWMRIGGDGYQLRVVEGLLEIKAHAAMLGYINADDPFTSDGWLRTGDAVEVEGDFFRVLGRKSEVVNVGGQKVFPAEVEGVLEAMPGVQEALVSGEKHPLVGEIVTARVRLAAPETTRAFKARMHEACRGKLDAFKVPQKVFLTEAALHGERFKKMRTGVASSGGEQP